MDNYRSLEPCQVAALRERGCSADNWGDVRVAPGFTTDYIDNVAFSGVVELGVFDTQFELDGGVTRHSGLSNVRLHNCRVGDGCLISNIANYIANYRIESGCFIENVNKIVVDGVTTFGNGTLVSVLNETGGRDVPIFNHLSAHLAYIIALYRHFPLLIEKIKGLVDVYVDSVKSDFGLIGRGSVVVNSGTIKNVFIGASCTIDGASRLYNGSLNSNVDAPILIGHNVTAQNFVVASGAHITDGATVSNCFVGQACRLSHLFSAHDSLFFSNCQAENGEACAVFAGPYTVTMHKSSLLIAGMFSFLNAGSGSNQSNHLYKLGPIHQGIVERGSKTTSDSYILWPARVGAFSLIMGRHTSHADTSDLPFSYLIENSDKSYVVPGVNLRSVGTVRDAQKWPNRDKRTDGCKLDFINFNLLSPYTIRKMISGVDLLQTLQRVSGESAVEYTYRGVHIRNSSLVKGIEYYRMAINKFLGNSLIKRLEGVVINGDDDIRRALAPDSSVGIGEWFDLSGLIAPGSEVERIVGDIESGVLNSVAAIECEFEGLHSNYYGLEWSWAWDVMRGWYGVDLDSITAADVARIVGIWNDAVVGIDKLLYGDARKEFSLTSRIGFGVDGDSGDKDFDFTAVRGDFDTNPFVVAVLAHIEAKSALGAELLSRLSIDNC